MPTRSLCRSVIIRWIFEVWHHTLLQEIALLGVILKALLGIVYIKLNKGMTDSCGVCCVGRDFKYERWRMHLCRGLNRWRCHHTPLANSSILCKCRLGVFQLKSDFSTHGYPRMHVWLWVSLSLSFWRILRVSCGMSGFRILRPNIVRRTGGGWCSQEPSVSMHKITECIWPVKTNGVFGVLK